MIDFEITFPETKKKTRSQIARDWMIDKAKRPNSNGYYEEFKKKIQLAQKKDEEVATAKKKMKVMDWIDSNVALYEPDTATDKQKAVLKRIQDENKLPHDSKLTNKGQLIPKVIEKKLKNKIVTKPTEENLYEIYLQMLKAGELLPNMSFKEFEKNFNAMDVQVKKRKKPTSPVEIDFSLDPTKTAFIGLGPVIKDSALYKLLDNPRVLGVELGHESIIEIINLLNRSGLLKDGGRVK